MADIAIFRINYKSDFILTLNSDAGWLTPFCIKFWTGAPSQAYFAGYDGTTYTHCAPVDGEPTKLLVQFDDHHLPLGDLKYQIAYHFTVADFPTSVEDEVLNQASVIIEVNDAPAQVMLDINGETAPEIEFSLPAYANEAQRIANEEERIEAEQQRIANEDVRIAAETIRQQNEAQRIAQETARVNEFATLKSQSQAATRDANDAATLANHKAQLAADKAALANDAATLANQKAQLAADKAALANDAAQLANEKAALAQQKAEYAQQQGGYAKDQGDYAKNQGDYAKAQGDTAQADHERAEADHGIAVDDHTQAGNDHTCAESDHGIAVDDHTQAGNDHTRAESDHGIAVDDHTQAGNDHTRAEADHGIAADDHTQAGNDHTRAESDHTRAESDHAAVEMYVDSLGVFDLSKHNAVGGVLATYADISAALTALNALDSKYKYGGMSFKFVRSSDNKYVCYMLNAQSWTIDINCWEKINLGNEINGYDTAIQVVEYKTVNGYGINKNSGQIMNSGREDYSVKIYKLTYGKTYHITIPELSNVYTAAYGFITNYRAESPEGALTTLPEPVIAGPLSNYETNVSAPSAELSVLVVCYKTAYGSSTVTTQTHVDGLSEKIETLEDSVETLEDSVETLEDSVETLEDSVGNIQNDTDLTQYENTGEWEHYRELGNYTQFRGIGTQTAFLDRDTKINCICFPEISASMPVKYFIGYREGTGGFTPSSGSTILKTGIINDAESTSGIKIFLDNPVTIPAGNRVFVLFYGSSGDVRISGGGNSLTEVSRYNNKTSYAIFNADTTIWSDPWSSGWTNASNTGTDRWSVCTPVLKLELLSIIKRQSKEVANSIVEEKVPIVIKEIDSVSVYLPNKLYAVVGDTLQLFFQGIVGVINISDYDIFALCSKGKTFPRYYSYTPTVDDIGTTTFTVYVKDRKNNILGEASCDLVTVAAPSSPVSMKSIFTLGDSLTAGGQWPGEAKRRLVGNSTYDSITGNGLSNISFFGYKNEVINEQSVDYFGVGGWTWANYLGKGAGGAFRFYVSGVGQLYLGATYTNNGNTYTIQEINVTGDTGNIRCTTSSNTDTPSTSGTLTKSSGEGDATIVFDSYETENANPLWDDTNNKMSFITYVHNCGASTIDAVYVLLSWNGQDAWKEYSVDDTTGHIANAKTFARTLHTEYPNAKLFIMGIQMPSDTGGLGANYGASGGYVDGYGLKQCALNYNKALQDLCNLDEFSPYCEFVAIAPQFDSHYNMPYYNTNVNIRSTVKEMLGSNGVHPFNPGYFQIADAVYRSIVANFCQS